MQHGSRLILLAWVWRCGRQTDSADSADDHRKHGLARQTRYLLPLPLLLLLHRLAMAANGRVFVCICPPAWS